MNLKPATTALLFIFAITTGRGQDVVPKIFLPGIVSSGLNERDMAISPDGMEMFYTIQSPRQGISVIIHRHQKAGVWSDAEVATFSGRYSDLEPAFSPDGIKLFFVSNRPVKTGQSVLNHDIWYIEKVGGVWGEASHAGFQVNSDGDEYYPSVTADGSLYFTAALPDALGKEDIYRSQWKDGQWQKPVNIGRGVNSERDEFNAFIDPKERYIIFSADGGEGDLGRGDLYVSYRQSNGVWSKARNPGAPINSNRLDYCPFVFKDTFYFTSERTVSQPAGKKLDFNEIKTLLTSAGNGAGDIYFIPLSKVITIQ